MITHLSVSGFRSLNNFEMEIHKGLNVLVGPNGSGKTNILTFLKFLSGLVGTSVSDAISRTGGAGAFFSKKGEEAFNREVSCRVRGITKLFAYSSGSGKLKYIQYQYTFTISASEDFDSVIFSEQEILFRKISKPTKNNVKWEIDQLGWDFAATQKAESSGETKIEVANINPKDLRLPMRANATVRTAKTSVQNFVRGNSNNQQSIIASCAPYVRDLFSVSIDFMGNDILNIIPGDVKKPEDSASIPGIQNNGAGVGATIFRLQKLILQEHISSDYMYRSINDDSNMRHILPETAKTIYSQIQQLISLINPSIRSIEVRNDAFSNILEIRLKVQQEDSLLILPLGSASDGTVKWISLIVAILTFRSIFAIEEPENFLHPKMQKELIGIMREDVARRGDLASVIMTTHSETILNAALPSEIIVVSTTNNSTVAKRLSNAREVKKEIDRTGFGLGYYYMTGALDA